MSALFRYSGRELLHHPLRTALALLGIAVATAMLADMLMLGSGIRTSFTRLLESRGYELRISPRGTLPFDTEASIPGFPSLRDTLAGAPDVAGIAPVLAAAVSLETGDGEDTRAFALGVDPGEQGVFRLLEGDGPAPGGIVVDRSLADASGLAVGDTIRVRSGGGLVGGNLSTLRLSGVADFLYASRDDRPVALALEDLQRLSGAPGRISFALVRVRADADPEAVRSGLAAAAGRVEVVTVAGLVDRAEERLSYFRQLALILGSVSLVVSSLLVGTIMAVSIGERIGTIAALRAIGIPRRSLLGSLTVESVIICAVGGAAGLGLGVVVARYLESILSTFPGLPAAVSFFVVEPTSLAAAYALLLSVGALAALVPAWRATGLEIATTLHAEEP